MDIQVVRYRNKTRFRWYYQVIDRFTTDVLWDIVERRSDIAWQWLKYDVSRNNREVLKAWSTEIHGDPGFVIRWSGGAFPSLEQYVGQTSAFMPSIEASWFTPGDVLHVHLGNTELPPEHQQVVWEKWLKGKQRFWLTKK